MSYKKHHYTKWSTPVIISAGLFVSISGILMLFGVSNPIEHAYEWIGLVFAIGMVLHVMNNWKSFKNYFTQRLAVSIVGSTATTSSPYYEGKVQGSLSIPGFYDNFDTEQGVVSNNEIYA